MSPKTSMDTPNVAQTCGVASGTWCCVRRRILQGGALAMLAPLGWFLLRSLTVDGFTISAELHHSWPLYLYMLLGALCSMSAFGYVVGAREQHLEQLNARLRHLSFTDGLTELRNARYFWQSFDDALARSKREDQPVSLVLFDLDFFKSVNDTHGHAVGDRVLEGIGKAIADEVRAGEIAARVGGEEFALLMPGAGAQEAERAAERIRRALAARRFEGKDGVFGVTVSGGVASSQMGEATEPKALFERADMALYVAKREGRDRVRVEPLREEKQSRARARSPRISSHDFASQSASGEWSL